MKTNRKPIFVISLPNYLEEVAIKDISSALKGNEELKQDYHILILIDNVDLVDFKLFSVENAPQAEYEKLEKLIKDCEQKFIKNGK